MERQLRAVFAADMVGYSRLMESDETGTVARLKTYLSDLIEPIIDRHGGRTVKLMGDGVLAEFASVVDAVRCAVEMQKEMAQREAEVPGDKQIRFRIGVNLGDVIVDNGDILGDGVNIAARLEQMAEAGGICISGTAFDHLKLNIDVGYQSLGEVRVKNISHPVRAYRVLTDPDRAGLVVGKPKTGRNQVVFLAFAAVIVLAGAGWWWSNIPGTSFVEPARITPELSDNRSVAVLAFDNTSGDPEQGYFAVGISEDISTDLSRVAGLRVIPPVSTKSMANDIDDPVTIANKLGVGHVLEGSIRRAGDQIRVTARLIEAGTGNQVWAERYDRETSDIFAIQDDITESVVGSITEKFGASAPGRANRSHTPNIRAYDFYIQGRAKRIPPTPPNLAAALAAFDKAIEIDPQFAGGYAGAAIAHVLIASDSTSAAEDGADHLSIARQLAEKAVALDPEFGPAWGSLAETRFRLGAYDAALEAALKAIEKAPADSLMRANYGRYLGHVGRAAEGIEEVKTAMRMSPDSLPMLYFLGAGFRANGQFDEAVEALAEHRKRLGGRVLPGPTAQLIAAYVQAGRLEEARAEAAGLLKVAPGYTAGRAAKTHPYRDPHDQAVFTGALVEAGLPR